MNLCVLCFTKAGMQKAEKILLNKDLIYASLKLNGNSQGNETNSMIDPFLVSCIAKGKYLEEDVKNEIETKKEENEKSKPKEIHFLTQPLSQFLEEEWEHMDAFVFIGACGIAVRSIAPFLKSKWKDPAVVVLDEKASFCISLLSGHVGGGNELCKILSDVMNATCVITTATDVNQKFSVDVFATKNKLFLSDTILAKEVSAYLLQKKADEALYLYDDFSDFSKERYIEYKEKFSHLGITYTKEIKDIPSGKEIGIYITTKKKESPFQHTLYLYPKNLSLGVGAKKGIDSAKIEAVFEELVQKNGWKKEMFSFVSSIDLKEKEQGILMFCKEYAYNYQTFTKEQLCEIQKLEGLEFTKSEFVKKVTGVDCVCERSAILRQINQTKSIPLLLVKKQKKDGVTLAVATTRPTSFII